MASMPLKGSMRQPKLEALQPPSTGGIVGMSFFFTLASNSCDSRIPSESLRFSICLESWSSCRLNSGIERPCGGMLDTAPPRPGGSLKRNSPGLSPASAERRSPNASSRISCACIWPSFTAIALRFSRRNSSVLRRCASWADKTSESSSVRLKTSSAMNTVPATKCPLVKVKDLALANLLETRIICTPPLFMHSQNMHPKNPCAFLNQPDGIASLMQQAKRLIELRGILFAVLPPSLARWCSIANHKQGKVVIFAASSAVAAKLKLMRPTLVEQLSQRGVEVTGLEVRVQPLDHERQVFEKYSKMSVEAAAKVAELCEQLPDSELKIALETIARRHGK